ncbi:MAG: hypothetical protein ABIP65_02115 [Vicinamibacterales bacterium]
MVNKASGSIDVHNQLARRELGEQVPKFTIDLRTFHQELLDQLLANLGATHSLGQQLPDTTAGVIQLENLIGPEMNKNRRLTEPSTDDVSACPQNNTACTDVPLMNQRLPIAALLAVSAYVPVCR